MQILKSLALVGVGAALVLLYQKYNEPMMRCIDKVFDKVTGKVRETYDDMM